MSKAIKMTAAMVVLSVLVGRQAIGQFAGGGGGGMAPAKPIEADFLKQYAVGAGEVMAWIKLPFPPSRRDAYISIDPAARMGGGSSTGWPVIPGGMIVQWSENGPTLKAKTPRLESGFTVLNLLRGLYGPTLVHPKADRRTLEKEILGDFALKAGAKEEELSQPCGKILSSALGKDVNVEVRSEAADLYVLSGEFKFKAIADELWLQTAPQALHVHKKLVHISTYIRPIWAHRPCQQERLVAGTDV